MRLTARAAVLLGLILGMASLAARAEELRVDTRDGPRSAVVRPAPRGLAPTVVVLHGAPISADYTESWYGFAEAAKKHGFAAVFPRGLSLQWNDGRKATLGSRRRRRGLPAGGWRASWWRAAPPIPSAST